MSMISINPSNEELDRLILEHGLLKNNHVSGMYSEYYSNSDNILITTTVPCGSYRTVHVNNELAKVIL